MNEPDTPVTVHLRIPGKWPSPRELVERLPAGYRLQDDSLLLPDAAPVAIGVLAPDGQFADVFRSSCRNPALPDELATVDDYRVNITLSGPGGSMAAARAMMRAGAAIIRAGGAGVFIDNSTLAHGGQAWLELTEDGGSDALSFAFVAVVGGRGEVYTVGMHVLGLRDVVMNRADLEAGGMDIIEVIRYLARNEKPVEDGHVLADLGGPRFQAVAQGGVEEYKGSPVYNPFGRLRLVSIQDIAESN